MTFRSPDLPVPAVIEIGEAFGGWYALSVRHYGSRLEDIRSDQVDTGGPMLARLLEALFRVPGRRDGPVDWYAAQPAQRRTWRGWLLDGLVDDAGHPVHGWRASLAEDPALNRLYNAREERIRSLVEACPERRDLVHGDLLHGNVLVTEDASQVTAVFSWKCSVRGDFLYDTAWCSFWGGLHPGVAAANPWGRIRVSAAVLAEPEALRDAALRHHCYELHIGAVHLGWNVWVDDRESLRWTARHTDMVLERGPLPD
jgi:aminoglycoside phosphotransferase (APT) family kinase protein